MSKNDMLAPIVRALVGVPPERLGVILDTVNKIGGADGELWRSCIAKVLREGARSMTYSPEVSLDTIIRVDRSIEPWRHTRCGVYIGRVMHLEIQPIGPIEYELASVGLWLHEEQKGDHHIDGMKIYKYLKQNKMLERCLSLRDGEEIQKKGPDVFRTFFQSKSVFLWKSISEEGCMINVPYLSEKDNRVVVECRSLLNSWVSSFPALLFAR